jgi:hypothetical protein
MKSRAATKNSVSDRGLRRRSLSLSTAACEPPTSLERQIDFGLKLRVSSPRRGGRAGVALPPRGPASGLRWRYRTRWCGRAGRRRRGRRPGRRFYPKSRYAPPALGARIALLLCRVESASPSGWLRGWSFAWWKSTAEPVIVLRTLSQPSPLCRHATALRLRATPRPASLPHVEPAAPLTLSSAAMRPSARPPARPSARRRRHAASSARGPATAQRSS